VLVALSALAMGVQSGTVLALGVRNITTTFVTGTLARLLHELAGGASWNADRIRQALVVVAVFVGAAVGALLLVHARRFAPVLPLAITVAAVVRGMRLWGSRG
jgi:uncharacterized membrane protein YoaK (UPF0700 family)